LVALDRAGVSYEVRAYDVDSSDGSGYGKAAAAALGLAERAVFKTLVAMVDGRATVAIVPVATQLSLKALAAAVGGKRAEMADITVAERITGYVAGGISPFGQKKQLPTVVDASVQQLDLVHVSAGRRGLEVALAPAALIGTTGATVAAIASA
jgi:Cys-tRNA(Pro)/Cys-tRNA(Cys) deacylase